MPVTQKSAVKEEEDQQSLPVEFCKISDAEQVLIGFDGCRIGA